MNRRGLRAYRRSVRLEPLLHRVGFGSGALFGAEFQSAGGGVKSLGEGPPAPFVEEEDEAD